MSNRMEVKKTHKLNQFSMECVSAIAFNMCTSSKEMGFLNPNNKKQKITIILAPALQVKGLCCALTSWGYHPHYFTFSIIHSINVNFGFINVDPDLIMKVLSK